MTTPNSRAPIKPPTPLEQTHDATGFASGVDELDDWLKRFAWVNHRSCNARVFVATRARSVVAYYALATAGVERAAVPAALSRGGVPSQIPCLLLARLAVDGTEQGNGVGRAMLVDAIRRAVRVADEVGVRALLIHARDDAARSFYEHQAEFIASPTDPLHLLLSIKHARRFT